jgi:TonB-linked SusC/RagA family outer membrane protein
MMKKTFIHLLLFFSAIAFHATAFAQISVSVNKQKIKQVMLQIEKNSDYSFFYSDDQLDLEREISMDVKDENIESILDKVFKGTNIVYKIDADKQILLTVGKQKGVTEAVPNKKYTGRVIDEKGEAIIGASVAVKGHRTGAVTDVDGRFSIEAPVGSTLAVFYVGYMTQELKLGENSDLHIVMQEDQQQLNEVVVVGYGSMRKSDVTGSLANIKASELSLTTSTFGQALVGKIAGVQVSLPNGTPGSGAKIRVRGIGSLSAGSTPLYVVDGYPASEEMYINPEDVESIDVLKDAASAAIYGSRGAAGVVMITTKRGAANKVRVDYDYQYGVAQLERKIKMMDAYQFRDLVIDARNNTYRDHLESRGIAWNPSYAYDDNATRRAKGGSNQTTIAPIFFDFTTGKPVEPEYNTDWQDAVYTDAATHRHNVAITGGNDMLQYRVSAGYLNQDGIIAPSNHTRMNLRANVDAQVTSRFKADFNYSFSDVKERQIPDEGRFSATDGIIQSALASYPQFPVYNPDGSYAVGNQIAMQADAYAQAENPVALAHEIDIRQTENRMNFGANLQFEIMKQLYAKANLGTQYTTRRYNYYHPRTVGRNQTMPNSPEAANTLVSAKDITNYEVDRLGEFTLNYKEAFGEHRIDGVTGFTVQRKTYDRVSVSTKGHPDDRIPELTAHGSNPGDVTLGSDTRKAAWSMLSYLARVNYAYADRYALSASLRTDGSSRFGSKNRWGWFPSVSAGWTLSNEQFYQNLLGNTSSAKLRASWGLSGNNNIGNYSAWQEMSQGGYPFGANSAVETAYWQGAFSDQAIGWEKTSQYNVGLDVSLFRRRVNLIGNYYYSLSYDLLYSQPISSVSGSSSVTTNLSTAKVRNTGIDLQIDTRILTGELKWNLSGNISVNRNSVVDMGGLNEIQMANERNVICHVTRSGLPVGSFYGYQQEGLISEADYRNILIDKANLVNGVFPEGYKPVGPAINNYNNIHPGDVKWRDVNGDGRITEDDRDILGDAYPDFSYGISTELSYKGVDLRATFTGQQGAQVINFQKYYIWGLEGYGNQLATADQRWRSEDNPGRGDIPRATRASTPNISNRLASFFVDDASYFRCANITIGYNFPSSLIKKASIQALRLYVSADNLFTITDYEGYNPEVDSYDNNLQPGLDWGVYPLSRTYSMGIKLTF